MNQSQDTEKHDYFRFGLYVLDPARRELRKEGKPVEIEPRAYDVLLYLARNRQRAVDKDELQDAVWPSVIVTETALTRAVMKARKAVDDDASNQAVIKTLHGHGYRFIAQLTEAEQSPDERKSVPVGQAPGVGNLDAPASPGASPGTIISARTKIAVVLMLFAVVAVLAWLGFRSPPVHSGDLHVAVLPVSDRTDNPELSWSRLGLMSFVSQLLASDGQLTVVPESSVVSLSDNLEWTGNADDPASLKLFEKLRRNFGATHILVLEIRSEGSDLRMNYHLLDTSGRSRSGTMVGDQPTELAQGVVQSVYGLMLHKSHISGEFPLVSEDPFNNEAFARGMSLQLAGRCAEARQFFKVIVEQEPDLFAPRYEYASCLRILGESEEAEDILHQLLKEQATGPVSRRTALTRLTLGVLYYRTGRPELAMAEYESALNIAEQVADLELKARVLQNLSIAYRGFSDLDEAQRHLDLAVLAYQDAGRAKLPGHLYSARANLAMSRGEFTEAENWLQQALEAFRDVGDRRNEAMMLNNSGYVKWQQGQLGEAETFILRSQAIRREIGDRVGVGRTYSMLSGVYSASGNFEKASEAASAALEIARESKDELYVATSLALLAEAEKAGGDLVAAREHYLEGRAIFVSMQDQLRMMQSDVLIARLDLMGNQVDAAHALAVKVLEQAREKEILEPGLEAQELLGDIELARGNPASAVVIFAEALEQVRATSWTSMETSIERKLANAYMDLGQLDKAAPIAGALAEKEPDLDILLTRARFDYLRSIPKSAVELMLKAKEVAGPNWSEQHESLLEKYRQEASR